MTNLILASASPRRRELLALLGLPFEVTVANVVEVPQTGEPPAVLVVRLSRAKARAACPEVSTQPPLRRLRRERSAERLQMTLATEQSPMNEGASGLKSAHQPSQGFDTTIIIACDTVVALDGELLGKPRDATEATAMLDRLRARPHTVYSGVVLLEITTGHTLTDVAETQVAMRAYTNAEIAAYVASGDPLDKAGAYAIQHPGFHPVAEIQGCYTNVMGLPLCHLTRCLRAWGIAPLSDVPAACQVHTSRHCTIYATILNDQ